MGCGSSVGFAYAKGPRPSTSSHRYSTNRNSPDTLSTDLDVTRNSIGDWSMSNSDVTDQGESHKTGDVISGDNDVISGDSQSLQCSLDSSDNSGGSGWSQGKDSLRSVKVRGLPRRASRKVAPVMPEEETPESDTDTGISAGIRRVNRGLFSGKVTASKTVAALGFTQNFGRNAWGADPKAEEEKEEGHNIEVIQKAIGKQVTRTVSQDKLNVDETSPNDSNSIKGTRKEKLARSSSQGVINVHFPQRESPRLEEAGDGTPRLVSHLASTERTVYPRDFFWWRFKKQLLGSYRRVCEVDEHVLQLQADSFSDIPSFLCELNRKSENEAERFRAIFRWVAANIAYKKDTECDLINSRLPEAQRAAAILDCGYGNCQGFSMLLKYLLNECLLGCEVVEGIGRGASYLPGCDVTTLTSVEGATRHCWNRVKVNGCWFLCDPTWACELEICDDEVIKKPTGFREVWFLTDPEIFIRTHMPLKFLASGKIVIDDDEQILYDSVNDLEEWNDRVWITCSGEEWGMKHISHPLSVIQSEENKIRVTFSCPHVMTLSHTLVNLGSGERLYGYVMIYMARSTSDVVKADVRLPGHGMYLLRIQAKPPFEMNHVTPGIDDTDIVFTYEIITSSSEPQVAFAESDLQWGLTPAFINTGCDVVDYKGATLEVESGTGTVIIQVPTHDIFPHMICFSAVDKPDVNLEKWVCADRAGHLVKVHFTLPNPGEYVFTFWVRSGEDEENFDVSISFLIHSTEAGYPEDSYPTFSLIWGLQEPAVSLGLRVMNLKSSIIKAKDGYCKVSIELSQKIYISHRLDNTESENWRRFVYAEQDGNHIHYHLRLPVDGRFKFQISGTEDMEKPHQIAVVLLIENPDGYKGHLYPAHENCPWGPRDALAESGVSVSQGECSSIRVLDGEMKMQITLPQLDFPLRILLTHANKPNEELDKCIASYRAKDPKQITMLVRLGTEGLYSLRLYESDKGTLLASYLLTVHPPCHELDYNFESYPGIYGQTLTFYQQGMVAYSPTSSYVKTDEASVCHIPVRAPISVELLLIVYKDGSEVTGHLYSERQDQKVLMHFRGSRQGFYQLRGYVKSGKKQHDLVFVYLIENIADCRSSFNPYPDCHGVWGLNNEALNHGIKVDLEAESQTVVRNLTGLTSITLTHTNDITLKAWIKPAVSVSADRAAKSVLVEKYNERSVVKVAVPAIGYFQLLITAAFKGRLKTKTVGSFLVDSQTDSGMKHGFPSFCNFSIGCVLFEPMVNPLTVDTEYYFQVKVPGAVKVKLWDNTSDWRGELSPLEGEVFAGEINVEGRKDLWVTAKFPKDDKRGEGGCYRNLLMYEVR